MTNDQHETLRRRSNVILGLTMARVVFPSFRSGEPVRITVPESLRRDVGLAETATRKSWEDYL